MSGTTKHNQVPISYNKFTLLFTRNKNIIHQKSEQKMFAVKTRKWKVFAHLARCLPPMLARRWHSVNTTAWTHSHSLRWQWRRCAYRLRWKRTAPMCRKRLVLAFCVPIDYRGDYNIKFCLFMIYIGHWKLLILSRRFEVFRLVDGVRSTQVYWNFPSSW